MNRMLQRREMLSLGGSVLGSAMLSRPVEGADREDVRARYLRSLLPSRNDVDDWLGGRKYPFAKFDPELGYLHIERDFKEGIIGAVWRDRYDKLGARQMLAYADRPCRINTYGNSFTSCEQVSDGETWQEVLARHLCEPVRNYGIGGYSVYQSFLRMVREERRAPAKTIVFNIFDDDHYRNILGWQRFKFGVNNVSINPTVPYMEVDLRKKSIKYRGNPCPDRKSLYRLTDLEWVTRTFQDNVYLANRLRRLTDAKAGKPVPPTDYDDETLNRYGLFATNAIIEGKIAKTAFVTTEGFRDMLEIARQIRPSLYDLQFEKPAPVARSCSCSPTAAMWSNSSLTPGVDSTSRWSTTSTH